MVIRKMNSVFARHGRIVFGGITLVIIVAFLGIMTPGQLFPTNRGAEVIGTAFGQDITVGNIQKQARDAGMIYCLQYNQNWSQNNPMLDQMAMSGAYPELCQLAAAKQRGVRVSDQQVADAIAKYPKFLDVKTKKFDMEKYNEFVSDDLKKRDLKASDLDSAVRNRLILQKLNRQIMESVIITDGEVRQYFRMAAEKFSIMTARFNGIDFEKDIKVNDKIIKAYFEARQKEKVYVIPRKYTALIIEFAYSKYRAAAAKSVTAAQVKKYYESNKALYKDAKGKTLPLTKVAAKISKQLIEQAARDMAVREAQTLATSLYEKIMDEKVDKKLAIFKQTVAKAKLKLVPSGVFTSPGGKLAGKWDEPELAKQISIAYKNAPVSNAVPGKNAAFLGYLLTRTEVRPAKFSEVKKQVISDYKREKAIVFAREKARALYVGLIKAKGKGRAALVKAAKNPVFKQIMPFSLQRPPMTSGGQSLAATAKKMKANGIAPPQENINGAMLVYMVKRTLPSEKDFEQAKQYVKYMYMQNKFRAAQVAFSAWVDSHCKQVQTTKK